MATRKALFRILFHPRKIKQIIPSSTFHSRENFFPFNFIPRPYKRKESLQLFLRECVKRRDILQNPDFQTFLDLEKNAPEVVGNTVTQIYDYKKCPLGVRDFIVVPHREIMCVCCSDMDIISRTNIKLTNFAFMKSKGDDVQIPMGAAFIYQCKPDPKEIYKIHKIWAKPFKVQTGTIHWKTKTKFIR